MNDISSLRVNGVHEHCTQGTFTTPWHWKMLHYNRRYSSLWPTYLIPFLYLSLVRRLLESITFAAYGNDVIGRVIFSRLCNSIEIYSTWATHDVVSHTAVFFVFLAGLPGLDGVHELFHGILSTTVVSYVINGTAVLLVYWCGRSRIRFPMVSLEFFSDIILPVALWSWGRLSL